MGLGDLSEFGTGGNDCGLCLLNGTLYYSTFFGYAARRGDRPSATGLTAAFDPATGELLWKTTDNHVTAGCTISGKDGRLYVGGYNKPNQLTEDRYVWCLDARDGSLVWRSEPVASAVNVITVGDRFLFTNASGKDGHVLDRATGKILSRFNFGYACTRFTLSEPYVLGSNMDLIDLSDGNRLVATGPAIDSRECVGSGHFQRTTVLYVAGQRPAGFAGLRGRGLAAGHTTHGLTIRWPCHSWFSHTSSLW